MRPRPRAGGGRPAGSSCNGWTVNEVEACRGLSCRTRVDTGCSALPVGQRVDVGGEEPLGGDRRGGVLPRGHLEHPLRVEARGSAGGDPVTEDLRRDLGMELKAEMAAGQERLRSDPVVREEARAETAAGSRPRARPATARTKSSPGSRSTAKASRNEPSARVPRRRRVPRPAPERRSRRRAPRCRPGPPGEASRVLSHARRPGRRPSARNRA